MGLAERLKQTVYSIAESDSFVFLIFMLGIEPMALVMLACVLLQNRTPSPGPT